MIFRNPAIVSALLAWTLAQSIKFFRHWRKTRALDFTAFVSTGGMPSAHSASVCALAASVGKTTGAQSPVFAVALLFAMVVMFDAQSVRRAAGEQARILNQIIDELLTHHHLSQQKLAELLGHTRMEVFAGMGLGAVTGLLV
jgi:acid phosphatase family membrane protein YuiD